MSRVLATVREDQEPFFAVVSLPRSILVRERLGEAFGEDTDRGGGS
jgi:hypothetical protein